MVHPGGLGHCLLCINYNKINALQALLDKSIKGDVQQRQGSQIKIVKGNVPSAKQTCRANILSGCVIHFLQLRAQGQRELWTATHNTGTHCIENGYVRSMLLQQQ